MVSFLLPKRLHQDFYNVYAFCRWADDLGDEIGDPQESLRLLAWWRGGVAGDVSRASRTHPVFVALQGTAARHQSAAGTVRRSDQGLRAGSDGHAVSQFRRAVRVLPLFRESRGPAGAGSVRLSRRRAAGAFRCDLHRAAARQFLAGRHRRSRKRPRLSAARCVGAPRLSGWSDCSRGVSTIVSARR